MPKKSHKKCKHAADGGHHRRHVQLDTKPHEYVIMTNVDEHAPPSIPSDVHRKKWPSRDQIEEMRRQGFCSSDGMVWTQAPKDEFALLKDRVVDRNCVRASYGCEEQNYDQKESCGKILMDELGLLEHGYVDKTGRRNVAKYPDLYEIPVKLPSSSSCTTYDSTPGHRSTTTEDTNSQSSRDDNGNECSESATTDSVRSHGGPAIPSGQRRCRHSKRGHHTHGSRRHSRHRRGQHRHCHGSHNRKKTSERQVDVEPSEQRPSSRRQPREHQCRHHRRRRGQSAASDLTRKANLPHICFKDDSAQGSVKTAEGIATSSKSSLLDTGTTSSGDPIKIGSMVFEIDDNNSGAKGESALLSYAIEDNSRLYTLVSLLGNSSKQASNTLRVQTLELKFSDEISVLRVKRLNVYNDNKYK